MVSFNRSPDTPVERVAVSVFIYLVRVFRGAISTTLSCSLSVDNFSQTWSMSMSSQPVCSRSLPLCRTVLCGKPFLLFTLCLIHGVRDYLGFNFVPQKDVPAQFSCRSVDEMRPTVSSKKKTPNCLRVTAPTAEDQPGGVATWVTGASRGSRSSRTHPPRALMYLLSPETIATLTCAVIHLFALWILCSIYLFFYLAKRWQPEKGSQ